MNGTITAREQRKRIEIPVVQMAVSKRFGMYKQEENKEIRAPEVAADQTLIQLRDAWVNFKWKVEINTFSVNYPRCLKVAKSIQYSARDVEKFSVALAEFSDMKEFSERAGIFLSALINSCPEKDFVVHTTHLRIDCLGYENSKNIVVDGDIGAQLGSRMKGGRIIVEGNTEDWSGIDMEKGEIIINGNGGWALGQKMRGGSITVNGNAGEDVGKCMTDGKITVNGNAKNGTGSYMKGGIIEIKKKAGGSAGIYMESGEIIIDGNCGDTLGENMQGGKISVKGNAGISVGEGMTGGEIRIEGKHRGLSERIARGKIYLKGKLVWKSEYDE